MDILKNERKRAFPSGTHAFCVDSLSAGPCSRRSLLRLTCSFVTAPLLADVLTLASALIILFLRLHLPLGLALLLGWPLSLALPEQR